MEPAVASTQSGTPPDRAESGPRAKHCFRREVRPLKVRDRRARLPHVASPDGPHVFVRPLPGKAWVGLVRWLGATGSAGLATATLTHQPWYIEQLPAIALSLAVVFATWYLLQGIRWIGTTCESSVDMGTTSQVRFTAPAPVFSHTRICRTVGKSSSWIRVAS